MNYKKIIKRTVLGLLACGIVVGGAGTGIYYIRNNNSKAVEVQPLSILNSASWAHWDDEDTASGTVRSDISQKVVIPPEQFIDEVFVDEGDEVKVGDKLMTFDTTLLELDQELQELTVQKQDIELAAAKKDLEKLKNTTPVARKSSEENLDLGDYVPGGISGYDPILEMDDGDDFDEARMYSNERVLLATMDEVNETQTSEALQEEEKDLDVILSPEKEEKEQETVAETSSENSSERAEEKQEEQQEIILDGESESEKVESASDVFELSPELNGLDELIQKEEEKEEEAKKLRNLSLKDYLNNIRMKAVTPDGETLILDTRTMDEMVMVTSDIKLNPHFREDGEHHFNEKATYAMQISGLKLTGEKKGKVYGIAAVNGDDYPEIGAYTVVQKDDSTAVLTIAFHDGLVKEHEVDPALEDMYVEIPLQQKEILTGSLRFIVSDDENEQRVIPVQNEMSEFFENADIPEEDIPEEDIPEEDIDVLLGEDLLENSTEAAASDENQESEQHEVASEVEIDTEATTETGEEDETSPSDTVSPEEAVKKASFLVKWNHGTNSHLRWPDALKLFFYADEEEDAQWSLTLASNGKIRLDLAEGEEGEELEDAEEGSVNGTESETESGSEASIGIEDLMAGMTDPTSQITDPDEIEEESREVWEVMTVNWPQDSTFALGEEARVWAYAENYRGTVSYDPAGKLYVINMEYQEPIDSPLIVFEPIEELDYIHGANSVAGTGMRAYKGDGTDGNPFVFLVKDGVRINSSFVNWALGFDAQGVIRYSDGYVVRLEIREEDSMAGVFLRSIELDGRILAENGYGPGTYWIFNSETGLTKYEEEIDDPFNGISGPSYDPFGDDYESYTAEELAIAIREKELEIRKLELEQREAKLKLKQFNKKMDDSIVLSAINGIVTQVGSSANNDAYLVVNSVNGMYIKTSVGEMELDSIAVGDTISCSSWDTGQTFTATISKIDTVPTKDADSFFNSNPNSSNYPVIAVVEDGIEMEEYDYVQVKFADKKRFSDIYLEKAYIRTENGKSYVFIRGEDGKLKKQYVKTGETSYGYVEIKAGLKKDAYIAFPYGKNTKEGAATKVGSSYDDE